MRRLFILSLLLFQFWIIHSQEITVSSISTHEILEYCKNKGGDSTLIKFNCLYIGLIDSTTCTYIFNSIKGDYKKIPTNYSRKSTRSKNIYFKLYIARQSYILNSSLFIKNQTLYDLVLETLYQTLDESQGGYIHETNYRISSLISQIKNTSRDTVLIDFANKWRKRAKDYDVSNYGSFWINIPVLFTGDYSKRVGNYLNCLKNEKNYLLAYLSINSINSEPIIERISRIKKEIFEITHFEYDLEPEIFKDNIFCKSESKNIQEYRPIINIDTLNKLDFKEYIDSTEIDQYTHLNLELIYNNKVGIMNKHLEHVNQRSVLDFIDYVEIQEDGHLIVKSISRNFLN